MSVFKEYVTSTAFNLTLTKPMCWYLMQLKNNRPTWEYSWSVPTLHRLIVRGLVERPPLYDAKEADRSIAMDKSYPSWQLTKAGELVAELVEIAGLADVEVELKKASS